MIMAEIQGLLELFKALKTRDTVFQAGLERGFKKAGLLLLRYSLLIVPVDTGLLRASGYTRVSGKGANTVVEVGYTAAYAVFVHENLDAAHGSAFNRKYAFEIADGKEHSRGENQQALFLLQPLQEHRAELRQIIASEGKVA